MEEIPQICFLYEEDTPSLKEIAQNFVDSVSLNGLDIRSEARPAMGPMACLEWYIPTAAILFLGKPYFDTFLKEMGKDHYHVLKKGTSSIWKKLFSKEKVVNFELVGTKGKLSNDNCYSMGFSILGESGNNQSFKFLFEKDISEEKFKERINLILNFMNAFHTDKEQIDEYFVLDQNAISRDTMVLIGYDKNTQKLINIIPKPKGIK